MSGRSLQASQDGVKLAREAFKRLGISQEKLAIRAEVSRWSVSNFMNGKPVKSENFVGLCDVLGLKVEQIIDGYEEEADISALVKEVRAKVYQDINYRCGTMRVLDMTQPIGLGKIYTQVNILEKITGAKRLNIKQLMEACGIEEFERFGLADVKQEKVPGLQAVKDHNRLMVLGKPGAGKTTFLKYLATQCNQGEQFKELVPIFVTLKEFAESEGLPTLPKYVEGQFAKSKVSKPDEILDKLLETGSAIVLLDGLDEVKKEDSGRILQQIEGFASRAGNCIIVVTCRIAAKEYTFEKFTEVEVADFERKQIEEFASKWFGERNPAKAEKFIEKIDKSKRVKELASSPLLLTLLCLLFEDNTDFPSNRYELYGEGVSVLLKKWDAKRNIERGEIYKNLSAQRKQDLLSQVALSAFEEGEYFFKQKRLEDRICQYVRNLPGAKEDPEALALDGEAVLKAIEAHHGLLVERARGIYSFSHLTLQEYFAARQIIEHRPDSYKVLTSRITDKAWREIVLWTANGLNSADELLLLLKENIDSLIIQDRGIQDFLLWLKQKSEPAAKPPDIIASRAIYFALEQNIESGLFFSNTMQKPNPSDILPKFKLGLEFEIDYYLYSIIYFIVSMKRVIANDSTIGSTLILFAVPNRFNYPFSKAITLLKDSNNVEVQRLELLMNTFPKGRKEELAAWFSENGLQWIEDFLGLIRKIRNICHDWKFNNLELLESYYEANKLLSNCLYTDCNVSSEVLQEIKDTLFLPMSEIKAYKARKKSET
ncbi:MAG: NACHT domain-containing protein [Synechococcus sp.]